jgi:hypothetical protein
MRLLTSCFIFLLIGSALGLKAGVSTLNTRRAFDEYGRIAWEDEKARLDNFAIQLSQDSSYLGYISVFQAPDMCKGDAEARAIRAKRYIVEYRNVPWNRVIWRAYEYRKELITILWVSTVDQEYSPPVFFSEPPSKETYAPKNCGARIAKIRRSKWN